MCAEPPESRRSQGSGFQARLEPSCPGPSPPHGRALSWCQLAAELAPASPSLLPYVCFSGPGPLPLISEEAICVLWAGRKLATNSPGTTILKPSPIGH